MDNNESPRITQPSLAIIYLEQRLRKTILQSIQYVLSSTVASQYKYLGFLYPYVTELSYLILLSADYISLKESGATSTEDYCGLKRQTFNSNRIKFWRLTTVSFIVGSFLCF